MQKKQISKFFPCSHSSTSRRQGVARGSKALPRRHRKHVFIAAHQAAGGGEGGRSVTITIRRSRNPRRGELSAKHNHHHNTSQETRRHRPEDLTFSECPNLLMFLRRETLPLSQAQIRQLNFELHERIAAAPTRVESERFLDLHESSRLDYLYYFHLCIFCNSKFGMEVQPHVPLGLQRENLCWNPLS